MVTELMRGLVWLTRALAGLAVVAAVMVRDYGALVGLLVMLGLFEYYVREAA